MNLEQAYGHALVSVGNVMARNSIDAIAAWNTIADYGTDYSDEHRSYLEQCHVPDDMIRTIMWYSFDQLMYRASGRHVVRQQARFQQVTGD